MSFAWLRVEHCECQKFCYLTVAQPSRSSRMWISDILKYINVLCAMATTIDTWMRCISQHISRIKWMIFPLPFCCCCYCWGACEEKFWRTRISREFRIRWPVTNNTMSSNNGQANSIAHTAHVLQERRRCRRRRGRRQAAPHPAHSMEMAIKRKTCIFRHYWLRTKPLFRKIEFSIKFTVAGVCDMRV